MKMKTLKMHTGFTLLEVMIALVIFSIGLLGLAGLQSAGIRNNQISYARTIAQQLAYDMSDRIRNNPSVNYSGVTGASANCNTASCNSTTMAALDVFEWNAAITAAGGPLKNAAGFIAATATGFTISIGWDENSVGGGVATACNPPAPAGFVCVSVQIAP